MARHGVGTDGARGHVDSAYLAANVLRSPPARCELPPPLAPPRVGEVGADREDWFPPLFRLPAFKFVRSVPASPLPSPPPPPPPLTGGAPKRPFELAVGAMNPPPPPPPPPPRVRADLLPSVAAAMPLFAADMSSGGARFSCSHCWSADSSSAMDSITGRGRRVFGGRWGRATSRRG